MSLRDQIENLVAEMLPPGPFWQGPAAERFIRAVAGAIMPAAELSADIFGRIQPETATRSVLEQWWNYLRGDLDCIATPASDADLRAAVVRLWRSEFSGTAAGMDQMISGFLPLVDVRESLPTSALPCDLPCSLDPTGRVFEIWHPSLQNTTEQVECVARRFMRDGDALRRVTAQATWLHTGPLASDTGFAFSYANGSSLVVERAPGSGQPATETNTIPLTSQHGFLATADAFPLVTPSDTITGQEFRWAFEKDFGAGAIAITAQQTGSHP